MSISILTKRVEWKKWIGIYNRLKLSRGDFRDLYVYGYDVPEAYVIEKAGKMYYAFFAPTGANDWHGTIELRGLAPGKYRVTDYENGTRSWNDRRRESAACSAVSRALVDRSDKRVSRRAE